MYVIGVLADTHVPDRARGLNPAILDIFHSAHVQTILHAGDVSLPTVLSELANIAPVYAVRGNRDLLTLRRLPSKLVLPLGGHIIAMTHGHGDWRRYMQVKLRHMRGYHLGIYQEYLLSHFPQAGVIVFGHSHYSVNQWVAGKLIFNPGSACCPDLNNDPPSVGLLYLDDPGHVRGEIIPLEVTPP